MFRELLTNDCAFLGNVTFLCDARPTLSTWPLARSPFNICVSGLVVLMMTYPIATVLLSPWVNLRILFLIEDCEMCRLEIKSPHLGVGSDSSNRRSSISETPAKHKFE